MILPQEWELGKVHTVERTEMSDLKFRLMLSGSIMCVLFPSTDPSNCLMRSGRVKLVLGIFANTAVLRGSRENTAVRYGMGSDQ
jgi:hypothetical protein